MASMSAFPAFQKGLTFLDFFAADLANTKIFLDHPYFHDPLLVDIDEVEKVGHFDASWYFPRIPFFPFSFESDGLESFELFLIVREVQQLLVDLIVPSQEGILDW